MENLPARGAPRQRTNRERSWHKSAPRPRRRRRTKGKSYFLLACPYSLADVLAEEGDGALACELGGFGVVGAALVAVEAVAGAAVEVALHLRVFSQQFLGLRRRRALVELAEIAHHRDLRLLILEVRHAAAVVGHRGGEARRSCGRYPRHRAAPAIANDADFARFLCLG